jgi:hypothetical protein
MKCVLCNMEIGVDPLSGWDQGHNAQPLANGRCCDDCQNDVMAERLSMAIRRAAEIIRGEE